MAAANKIVHRLLEGIDDPEAFDVQGHLASPVSRLAKTNGFVRDDRNTSEERWVKPLSAGREAWLRTYPYNEINQAPAFDPKDPQRTGGREWELIVVRPTLTCKYCNQERKHDRGRCPHCKQSKEVLRRRDFSTIARANEMTMNYLLGAVLQRLATWPAGVPKPDEPGGAKTFETLNVDEPSKEHIIRMGRAGECEELCPHCGAYCTLKHYNLPSGIQMPQYHICQTCDLKLSETEQRPCHNHVLSEGVDDPEPYVRKAAIKRQAVQQIIDAFPGVRVTWHGDDSGTGIRLLANQENGCSLTTNSQELVQALLDRRLATNWSHGRLGNVIRYHVNWKPGELDQIIVRVREGVDDARRLK